jgi:serine/threonine protein kinase
MQDQGFRDGYYFYRLSIESNAVQKKDMTWTFSKVIKFFSVGLSSRLAHKIENSEKETQRVQYLNELKQNVLYISIETKTPQGWNLRRSKGGVEQYIMTKTLRDPATKRRYNSRVSKTIGRIKIDAEVFVKEFCDLKTRSKWDVLFKTGKVVTQLTRTAQIIYRTSNSLIENLAPRDVVVFQDHFKDGGAYTVFEISVDHAEVPEVEGVTRAMVLLLAYTLRPVLNKPGYCDVTFISQVDFKANNVPEWFVEKWMGLDIFGNIEPPSASSPQLPTEAEQEEFSGVLIDRYASGTGTRPAAKSAGGTRDFKAIAVLGRGAYSKIVQVQDKKTKEVYAMKVLRKNDVIQSRHVRHVMAERNILKVCAHPFIVKLYYSFQTQSKLYMIMDFAAGGDLFTYLRRKGLAEPVACFYTAELVLGLRHIHKLQIAHRDVKPENILFGKDGHILLADFGLSKEGMGPGKRTFSLSGTSEYLAPEMILNKGHGRMVDWWQIGIILHEMLTGKHPFYSQNPYRMHQNVLTRKPNLDHRLSKEARSLLNGFFIKDPSLRLGSRPSQRDIESHPFFTKYNTDWNAILLKKIKPPFKPNLKGAHDVSHFEDIFTREDPSMSPSPGNRSLAQSHEGGGGKTGADKVFDGFSYDVHKAKDFLKPSIT